MDERLCETTSRFPEAGTNGDSTVMVCIGPDPASRK